MAMDSFTTEGVAIDLVGGVECLSMANRGLQG
jgi:hypothetical protein